MRIDGLYSVVNVRPVSQVYLLYRARLLEPRWDPGPETLEARLFAAGEVPWDRIAFRAVSETLRRYFDELAGGGRWRVQAFDID